MRLDHALIFLAIATAVAPFSILVHEAGHAVAALLLGGGAVVLVVGAGTPFVVVTHGRFSFALATRLGRGGVVYHEPFATTKRAMVVTAAGPAANLVLGVGAGVLALRGYAHGAPLLGQYALVALALDSLASVAYNGGRNIFPGVGQDLPTDGEQLARLAGKAPLHAPVKTSLIAYVLIGIVALVMLAETIDRPGTFLPLDGGLVALAAYVVVAERRDRAR